MDIRYLTKTWEAGSNTMVLTVPKMVIEQLGIGFGQLIEVELRIIKKPQDDSKEVITESKPATPERKVHYGH